jgi:hypothetical protein
MMMVASSSTWDNPTTSEQLGGMTPILRNVCDATLVFVLSFFKKEGVEQSTQKSASNRILVVVDHFVHRDTKLFGPRSALKNSEDASDQIL